MSEVIRGFGSNADSYLQVDPTHDAGRMSIRPWEVRTEPQGPGGGHFCVNGQSGTMAAGIASAADIFHVRWAPASTGLMFGLLSLKVQACTLTGFAATAVGAPLQLFHGVKSTAAGSGGTPLNANIVPLFSAQSLSAFTGGGEIRIASTAALTAPTGASNDPNPVGGCLGAPNATLVQSPEMYLFDSRDFGGHPLFLSANDTLQVLTLNPAATGTWVFTITMKWLETYSL